MVVIICLRCSRMSDGNNQVIKPNRIILNDLELEPYQYTEDIDDNNRLTISTRVYLTDEQYTKMGLFSGIVKVIRSGIDRESREMTLVEVAWSKKDDLIKEQIELFDTVEESRQLWADWEYNKLEFSVEQHLMIKEMLAGLISKGIFNEVEVKQMKNKITKGAIWNTKRELNRTEADLDDYEM